MFSHRSRPALVAATALLWGLAATAPAQLRVASYNISFYSGGRIADIQNVVYGVFQGRSMSPDILALQEIDSQSALNGLVTGLNSAIGSPGDWAAGGIVDDGPQNNSIAYRTSKLRLTQSVIVQRGSFSQGPQRTLMRYDFSLVGYTGPGAALSVYVSHMRASDTDSDRERRRQEAVIIRDNAETLPAGRAFLLAADLNTYFSAEPGYTELTNSQPNNNGRLFDPIASPGNWNNNNSFRFLHTQDPIGAGGMDDRFDQVLLGPALVDGDGFDYSGRFGVPYSTSTWDDRNHSYRAWGNDGFSFNSSLRTIGNQMVGESIAQSIRNVANGAGHIPVFLDLLVPPKVDAPLVLDFGTVRQGSSASLVLNVANSGNTSLWGANGIALLRYSLIASSGFGAPGGNFTEAAGGGANSHTITMDTSTPGLKVGFVDIISNAPEQPRRTVEIVGFVRPNPGALGNPIRRVRL